MSSPQSVTAASGVPASTATASTEAAASDVGTLSTSTKIGTMADIKKISPKLYNAMMQGIALSICMESQRLNDHLVKAMRGND
jgi:hypothetical protein